MEAFKKGQVVKDATLMEFTEVDQGGTLHPAWVCRVHDEIKIIKERDLRRRKGTRTGRTAAAMNVIYSSYQLRCRKKNIYWELTIEQFHTISQQNCVYCGVPPSNGGGNNSYIYNGIDRKVNTKGYTLSNSLACCARCNGIKSHHLSYEEMMVAMTAILAMKTRRKNHARR